MPATEVSEFLEVEPAQDQDAQLPLTEEVLRTFVLVFIGDAENIIYMPVQTFSPWKMTSRLWKQLIEKHVATLAKLRRQQLRLHCRQWKATLHRMVWQENTVVIWEWQPFPTARYRPLVGVIRGHRSNGYVDVELPDFQTYRNARGENRLLLQMQVPIAVLAKRGSYSSLEDAWDAARLLLLRLNVAQWH